MDYPHRNNHLSGIMGSVLVIISQFLNNSKRNARQPGQLSDS